MKFKRLVSTILCVVMILSNTLIGFATDSLNNKMTTETNSEKSDDWKIVNPTSLISENDEEIIFATDSDAEEEEITEYEEEKECDEEESVVKVDAAEESDKNIDIINESDVEKENISEDITTEENKNDEITNEESSSIEEKVEESKSSETVNEESKNSETTSEESESSETTTIETVSLESKSNNNIDSDDVNDNNIVASASETDDYELLGLELEEILVSTNSEADLSGTVEENIIIATNNEIEEKVVATKSNIDRKQNKNFGYRPSSFSAKPVNKREFKLFGGLMNDTQIPRSYDSRDHRNESGLPIIPPVRNQGNYGTCWAFSTIGMFETSLRSQNLVITEEESNLSEAALAYFTLNLKNVTNSNKYMDKPGYQGRDYTEINVEFFKKLGREADANFANCGGNQVEPLIAASTYMGVVKENADTNYNQVRNIIENGLDGKYAYNSNDFEIGNAQFINKEDTDLIKKAIMKNGSVGANYCEARDEYNCHKFGDDYYYLSDWWNVGSANHAILIVGWDDNIPKERFYTEDVYNDGEDDARQATHNGGWLIRNSWGDSNEFMNAGYFWISYDDVSLENTFYTVEAIPKDTYKYNYHYDGSSNDHDGVLSGAAMGNVFQVSSTEDQVLQAVNIALQDPGEMDIEIYTNTNKMKSPTDGSKVTTKRFSTQTAGIFTIDLDKDVFLKKGTYFSIILSPHNSGIGMFIDNVLIYEGSARTCYNEIALGQSFYLNANGTAWIDLNAKDTKKINNITYGQNYRIRALTNPTDIIISFDANGGEGEMPLQGALTGKAVNIDKNQFTRPGYIFVGWRDENNNFYSDGAKITLNHSITLYAEWEEAYKITFVGNGGLYNGESEYVIYVKRNSEVTLDSCKFKYTGFIFNKWSSQDGKEYSNGAVIEEVTGDMILTAEWIRRQSTNTDTEGTGGSSGGSGGGGGGGGNTLSQLPNAKPAETTVAKDLSTTPINFNTINSTWTLATDGKWHLNVVGATGIVEEVKNQWACISKLVNINGQQITVQDLYYFDEKGNMLTGWLTDSTGKKYFLDNDMKELGKLIRGWKKIENNYYYFDEKGVLFTSCLTPDGYTVSSTGVWLQ